MPEARLTLLRPQQILRVTLRSGANGTLTLGPPVPAARVMLSGQAVLRGQKGDQGDQGIQGLKGDKGDQGEKGDTGPMAVAIQPTAPDFGPGQPGLWIQTGAGPAGNGFTFWIEDGL